MVLSVHEKTLHEFVNKREVFDEDWCALTDFGLGKFSDGVLNNRATLTINGQMGTPGFLAPVSHILARIRSHAKCTHLDTLCAGNLRHSAIIFRKIRHLQLRLPIVQYVYRQRAIYRRPVETARDSS